jgi:hypothetical protein
VRKEVRGKFIGLPGRNCWHLSAKEVWGLGICRKFNQDLLACQAWRVIQFPDSLCATLLRAKYFLNGELVDTVFPTNASPMWWSIEYGPELLKKGIVWRVGSGAKIQIWRDSWLPRATSRKKCLKCG